ncbi:hypothetical protein VTO42DRAFT_3225 [Malbranchea cinnamomea]
MQLYPFTSCHLLLAIVVFVDQRTAVLLLKVLLAGKRISRGFIVLFRGARCLTKQGRFPDYFGGDLYLEEYNHCAENIFASSMSLELRLGSQILWFTHQPEVEDLIFYSLYLSRVTSHFSPPLWDLVPSPCYHPLPLLGTAHLAFFILAALQGIQYKFALPFFFRRGGNGGSLETLSSKKVRPFSQGMSSSSILCSAFTPSSSMERK